MSKIQELNIDEVVDNIVEFYREESNKDICERVVREFVEQWAENKYELYQKMGNRLRVSSEIVGKDFISEVDFLKQVSDLKRRRSEKQAPSETDRYAVLFFTKIERYLFDWQKFMKNVFDGNVWRLEDLIRSVFSTPSIVDELKFDEKIVISNKGKYTKAVAAYLSHEKIVDQIGEEQSKKYIHILTSLISEVKQACESGTKTNTVVLSIHPYDYATMSWNQLGWRSCYSPDGEYAKSPFVVMADKSTLIAYSESSKFQGSRYEAVQNDKKVRTMVHFDATLEDFIINTVYPPSAGAYEELVAQTVVENGLTQAVIRADNASYYMPADKGCISVSEAIYNDLPRNSEISDGLDMYVASDRPHFWFIGVHGNVCMSCGDILQEDEYDEDSLSSWYCYSCDPEYYESDEYEDEDED